MEVILNFILALFKSNTNTVTMWLARQFDKLKIANPIVFTIVIALLTGVNYLFSVCAFEILCSNEWFKTVALVLSSIVAGLIAPRTTRYIEQADAENQAK